jgi:hypothetical protein
VGTVTLRRVDQDGVVLKRPGAREEGGASAVEIGAGGGQTAGAARPL